MRFTFLASFAVCAASLLSFLPSSVYAAGTQTGPVAIGSVSCQASGQYCSFVLKTNRTNQPSCAGTDQTFIFQTNTTGGQAILSTLLTAKVSGWQVTVNGKGTCATSTLNIAEEWVDYITVP